MRLATDLSVRRPDAPLPPLLLPFVDRTATGATAWDRRYDRWIEVGADRHELVSDVGDADLVVLPTDWYWVRGPSWASRPDRELAAKMSRLHETARRHGVPTLVHFSGDRSCDRVRLDGAIVAREGPFRSRMGSCDLVLPAFAEDLVHEHLDDRVPIRDRSDRPVVGFCGLAGSDGGLGDLARLAAYRAVIGWREHRIDPSPRLGVKLRSRALSALDSAPEVDTNFVVRDSSVFFKDASTADLVDVRAEYVENMRDCDYVLCARGSGNYSFRLYEALSMGRIPVVIDTDVALPLTHRVPWGDVTVHVAPDRIGDIGAIIADHHASFDEAGFEALQRRARAVWVDWLAPEAFYSRLDTALAAALAADGVARPGHG